jgi:hypothetical protein
MPKGCRYLQVVQNHRIDVKNIISIQFNSTFSIFNCFAVSLPLFHYCDKFVFTSIPFLQYTCLSPESTAPVTKIFCAACWSYFNWLCRLLIFTQKLNFYNFRGIGYYLLRYRLFARAIAKPTFFFDKTFCIRKQTKKISPTRRMKISSHSRTAPPSVAELTANLP